MPVLDRVFIFANVRAITVANMFTSSSRVKTAVNNKSTMSNKCVDVFVGVTDASKMFAKKFAIISPATESCNTSDMYNQRTR